MRDPRGLRRLAVTAAAVLVVPVVAVAANVALAGPAQASTCSVRTPGDVDGDGRSDLVIGRPVHPENPGTDAVVVFRGGSAGGLTMTGSQVFSDSVLGLTPLSTDEQFGLTAVIGFFDGDCYADAVIGVYDVRYDSILGAIVVLRGTSAGLDLSHAQRITAAQLSVDARSVGHVLAAGDFNHDGYDDLAAGAPGTSLSGNQWAGGVSVLYGSAGGLTLTGRQWFTQSTAFVLGDIAYRAGFGDSLTAADFDRDGYADLAVGVPGQEVSGFFNPGAVVVLRGSAAGLTASGSIMWSEDTNGIPGGAEEVDDFGGDLAAGDVTGDGYSDLVVAARNEVDGAAIGAVWLIKGSPFGLTSTGSQVVDQSTAGFPTTPALDTGVYGMAVAVADFNHDGRADVAFGAPETTINSMPAAGAFAVLYGTSAGFSTTNSAIFSQANLPGLVEAADGLGLSLYTLPVTATGYPTLIVSAPGESSSGFTNNGGVEVLPGGAAGITAAGAAWVDGAGAGLAVSYGQMGWPVAAFDNVRFYGNP